MTKRQATHYPNEFKESSAKLAVESKESVAQIAKNLGVHVATLHGWVKKYLPIATENYWNFTLTGAMTESCV